MPTIATFKGIKIDIYVDEHPPPHFHARYAEFVAESRLVDFEVREGSLPLPQLRLVREWASSRAEALQAEWIRVEQGHNPRKIP